MAVAFVRSLSASVSAGTTVAVTAAGATAAGNALVSSVTSWTNSGLNNGTVNTIGSSVSGTTFARAAVSQQGVGTDETCADVWVALNAPAGTHTVTTTFPGSSFAYAHLTEYSGVLSASAVDRTGTAGGRNTGGSSVTATVSTAATTQADEVVHATIAISATAANSGSGASTPTGYTAIGSVTDSSTVCAYDTSYRILAATGAQSASWTVANLNQWAGALVTLKAAGGGGAAALAATPAATATRAASLSTAIRLAAAVGPSAPVADTSTANSTAPASAATSANGGGTAGAGGTLSNASSPSNASSAANAGGSTGPTATATLTTMATLASSPAAASTSTAALLTAEGFAAGAAGASAASGGLTTAVRLAATAAGASSSVANPTTGAILAATAEASSTRTAALDTAIRPAATASGSSTSTASLLAPAGFGGAPAGSAAGAGDLSTLKPVAGFSAAASAASASLLTVPLIHYALAAASASGSLTVVRGRPPKSGRQRLLGLLNRVFEKGAEPVLALRPNAPPRAPAGGARWTIVETPALTSRALLVQAPGAPPLSVGLEDKTIAQVRDALAAGGIPVAYATPDPALLSLSALALAPGDGLEGESNGDHVHAQTSLLWSWADPVGRWLDQSRADIAEMLRMLVVRQSGEAWSDLWASYFGIRRRLFEGDEGQNRRTEREWRRSRNNAKAIELNVREILGRTVTVREPWREMMTVSVSTISGGDHLPNNEEFCYHRIQLRSEAFEDWSVILEEADADRPAGTLMIAPVTLPPAWLVDAATGRSVEFGMTSAVSGLILDYDGHIISHNWDLSNTFVAMAPVITWPELFQLRATAVGASAASAGLRTGARLAGAPAAASSTAAASLSNPSAFAASVAASSAAEAELRVGVRLRATTAASATRTAALTTATGSSTTTSTVWPTANRTWLFDPDEASRRVMDGSRIASLAEVSGDTTRSFAQNNNPSARPPMVTERGRAVMDFDQGFANFDGSATVTTDFRAVGFASTYAVVWVTPASAAAAVAPFMGAYTNGVYAPANMLAVEQPAAGRKAKAYRALSGGGREAAATFNWQPNTAYLVTYRYNADGTITVFVGASKLTTLAPNGGVAAGASISASGSQLGGYWPEGGALGVPVQAQGKIGAVMRYGVALTDAEVATLAGVASNRYPSAAGNTLWANTVTPATSVQNDTGQITVGTVVRVTAAGRATALRFWKGSTASSVPSVRLWSGTTQIAEAVPPANAPVGWVEVALAAPVSMATGLYTVSAFYSAGRYPEDLNVFSGGPVVSGPIRGVQDNAGDGRNGVFVYGASHALPTQADPNGRGYYVDLRFVAD